MLPTLRIVVGTSQMVVSLHALAVVVGVAAGALVVTRRTPAPTFGLATAAIVAVVALVGAHGLFRLLHGGPGGLWSSGLASMGGVGAGTAAACLAAWITRRPVGEVLDAVAPGALLALGIGRIGCFLAGCCYGRPTALPWGVVFPALGLPARHPLQLYSAAGDLGLLLLLRPRPEVPGLVACRACIGLGCLRGALECLRDPGTRDLLPGGSVTLAQAVALVLVVAGLVGVRVLRGREPSTMPPRRRS
ncbi:MAG TPA: prolipoprotein diacylglyceryl transferase family protein [Candidatus Binatus sp.]|nr:prolipoprotein diacylglyceryl transferase family protein [Candidatus Binatus sp.]